MEQNSQEQNNYIRGVIEAILFVNEKPVALDQLKKVLETVTTAEIKETIESLKKDYEERRSGMAILEIAGGYQMLSNPVYAQYLHNFYKTKHKEKLSKPALETLAIVAYKEPVTRADIEIIRGVNSDGVVAHLLEKELIKMVGRKDIPGKPYLYGTTKQFLEYFGLKSLEDLPKLEEFPNLRPAGTENLLPLGETETAVGNSKQTPAVEAPDSSSSLKEEANKEEPLEPSTSNTETDNEKSQSS